MKRCLLGSFGFFTLLLLALTGGAEPAASLSAGAEQIDAVSATSLPGVGEPLSARAAGVAFLNESGDGRVTRSPQPGGIRIPTCERGPGRVLVHDGWHSHSCHMAARLARGGIHNSALGTPPPHV